MFSQAAQEWGADHVPLDANITILRRPRANLDWIAGARNLAKGENHHERCSVSELFTRAPAFDVNAAQYIGFGRALQKQGRHDEAVAAYDKALALDPASVDACNGRGTALYSLHRYDEALLSYDRAAALRPRDAGISYNQGTALLALGRHLDALERYDRAISLDPLHAAAHMNCGLALQRVQRYEDSLVSYDRAIALKPGWADAHNDRGAALQYLGRHEEALASHDEASALDPECADARYNQGNALLALHRFAEALTRYDQAISLRSDHVQAHFNRGNALLNLGRCNEALASYETAGVLRPDYAAAFYNQGVALMNLERYAEALSRLNQALALNPDHADAHTNRGNTLRELQRYQEALSSYDESIARQVGNAWACLNKAQLELALGNFKRGWPLYESRWHLEDVRRQMRIFPQAQWLGTEPLEGKTILLHAEQGLGDTIQFCRFVPLLVERGARVVFEVPRAVVRLMEGLPGGATIVAKGDELPEFDFHCPLMSVPARLGTTVDTIPLRVPYLTAEAERVAHWRERLPAGDILIGISWQGNPAGAVDRGRSAPLGDLAPLARVPGVRLISLQKHHGLDQLGHLPPGMAVETMGPDFDEGPDSFVDTAALIESLDLVISTDTAIVHLAGALDRPIWVALKAVPYWTWMFDREDSPWYPSARLFRQDVDGDWRDLFERMAANLFNRRGAKWS